MPGKITTYMLRLAMVVAVLGWITLPAFALKTMTDSVEVTKLLSEAKTHAIQLREDASLMESFIRSSMSNISWQTHATQISKIKEHVNNLGQVVQRLHEARGSASAWQQEAIDRVTPVLKETAASVEATIEHLNQNPTRLHEPAYRDFVKANYELATRTAEIVSDFVEYGSTKAKFERLEQKLEVAQK